MNIDVSVILPLKSQMSRNFDELFSKAINSISEQTTKINELVIVYSNEESLVNFIENYDFGDIKVKKILFNGESNYSNQINKGVSEASSTWVSFFEFDDEYSKIWFKNVKKYIDIYNDIDAFMPIVVDVDDKGVFVGFTNEATFATSINQEMGYLNNEILHNYQNFQTSGMVIKKDVFESTGGFKTNFKLTFTYEFLLRLTHNGNKILTIPKIGYKHMNLREGSLFWNYKFGDKILTPNEVKFWVDTAKKEYFFKNQRDINYVE